MKASRLMSADFEEDRRCKRRGYHQRHSGRDHYACASALELEPSDVVQRSRRIVLGDIVVSDHEEPESGGLTERSDQLFRLFCSILENRRTKQPALPRNRGGRLEIVPDPAVEKDRSSETGP